MSDLMVRPRRARLQVMIADLKAERSYVQQDFTLIDQALDEARSSVMVVVLPVLIPVALSRLAVTGIRQRLRGAELWSPLEALELMRFRDHELKLLDDIRHSRGTVRADPRFRRLSELAFEVEAFRWPLVWLVTVTLALPALLLYLVAYGAQEAVSIIPQLGFWFIQGLRLPRPMMRHEGRE
jgi:hypothetical protein